MLVRVLGAGVKVPLEDPDVPVCQTAQSSKTWEQIQTAEIAAIPAQSFALLLTVPLLLVMEKMSKAELVLHLRTYGEEPPKAWTKLELRQRLNDLAEQGEITIETGKKAKTPLQAAVTELNRASHKKSDLVKFVERRLEMVVTPNETVAAIQKRAMQSILLTTEATGEDTMGFGKFASRTYADAAQTEVNYVTWCCQTAREGDCSVYLQRFVNWVEKEKPPLGENDRKKMVVTRWSAGTSSKPMPSTSMDEHATSSTTSLIKELTGTVAKLAREVQELTSKTRLGYFLTNSLFKFLGYILTISLFYQID